MANLHFLIANRRAATAIGTAAAFAVAIAYAQSEAQGLERDSLVTACERASALLELEGFRCQDVRPIPLLKKLGDHLIPVSPKAEGMNVFAGEVYKNFNTWRRLRVATAAFVEPELVDRTKVGFYYPVAVLKTDDVAAQRLAATLKAGVAKLAFRSIDESYLVVGPELYDHRDPLSLLKQAHAKGTDMIGLVSDKADLLGMKPTNQIVSWSAPFAVAPADPAVLGPR